MRTAAAQQRIPGSAECWLQWPGQQNGAYRLGGDDDEAEIPDSGRLIRPHAAGGRRGCGQDGKGQKVNGKGSGQPPDDGRAIELARPIWPRSANLHNGSRHRTNCIMRPDRRQRRTACHQASPTNACIIGGVCGRSFQDGLEADHSRCPFALQGTGTFRPRGLQGPR